jgi:hypothetical protein
MKDNSKVTFENFKKLTEETCSDMFLAVYLLLRRSFPLYDQVYLYATKIKNIPRGCTPRNLKVISSPKMLGTLSPVAALVKRPGSCRHSDSKSNGKKSTMAAKSRFGGFGDAVDDSNSSPQIKDTSDFSSAFANEDVQNVEEQPVQKIPLLKVNCNDLRWHKETKTLLDTDFNTESHKEVVRIPSNTGLQKFASLALKNSDISKEPKEDVKASNSLKLAIVPASNEPDIVQFCECGGICEPSKFRCNECLQKQVPIDFSSYMYSHIDFGIKMYWFRLLNMELYCNPNVITVLIRLSN